ncbi:hypothetical protein DAEQUDRAFT_593573 [Daedalea quercina L-15889]|uniref:Uncharacterized protein n=1 Tax=Daedalea quercina L-15889 TaxID=1314783 RepID=A0A165SXD2_9APHY|nr:hypothetical protein DAEQUDRAFT_593573 [Daedalea quercina L-15889]
MSWVTGAQRSDGMGGGEARRLVVLHGQPVEVERVRALELDPRAVARGRDRRDRLHPAPNKMCSAHPISHPFVTDKSTTGKERGGEGEGHAPVVVHDELVRRDVHLRARELELAAARGEAARDARGRPRAVGLAPAARDDLRRAVHVHVWPRKVEQPDDGAAGGDDGERGGGHLCGVSS